VNAAATANLISEQVRFNQLAQPQATSSHFIEDIEKLVFNSSYLLENIK